MTDTEPSHVPLIEEEEVHGRIYEVKRDLKCIVECFLSEGV